MHGVELTLLLQDAIMEKTSRQIEGAKGIALDLVADVYNRKCTLSYIQNYIASHYHPGFRVLVQRYFIELYKDLYELEQASETYRLLQEQRLIKQSD